MKLRGSNQFSQARDANNVKKEIHIHARAARSSGVYSAIIHATKYHPGDGANKNASPPFLFIKANIPVGVADANVFLPSA